MAKQSSAGYVYDDGGRKAAGFKGDAGDCVTRAVAIASGLPYADVYKALAAGNSAQRVTRRSAKSTARKATARNGINVRRKWFREYMTSLGATWTPTMQIGSGCRVHLNANELPEGRLVCAVSKHYVAVIDGVIHDTFDPRERGATIYTIPADQQPKPGWRLLRDAGVFKQYAYEPERCVYGYWTFPQEQP